ncbi:hypothetical protein CMI37_21720 [Candidatus Pacearchaeota archaeon]|nr:hypothetical protein [Candidatus Pacearchaeota archaeon]|tara:strand:+ start:2157 stop:2339 length:183 start_codon:yes stop_codon:yes gene_type:complete
MTTDGRPKADAAETPNPGSDEALRLGCLCPVLDNNHGAGLDGLFIYAVGCPVHDAREEET